MLIDLHSHILPGLDDGAPDIRTAIKMARLSAKEGVCEIVATPHCYDGVYNCTKEEILMACTKLNRALQKAKVDLIVHPGAELRLTPELISEYDKGNVLTLGDAEKAILLEMPERFIPQSLKKYIKQFNERGLEVVIAHPERNYTFRNDPAVLEEICQAGASIQLTAGSIIGKFGREIKNISLRFAENIKNVYTASDSHNLTSRSPKIKKATNKLKSVRGEQAFEIMTKNSQYIITKALIDQTHICR